MKLYMVKGTIDNTSWGGNKETKEVCLGFVGTQVQAKKSVKKIIEELPHIESPYWEPEEVPTNKAGLLTWLNEYCHDDADEIIKTVIK